MNSTEQRIIDLASRDKIVHNINQNFFVEAGAGSGKTTVLVERMIAMVEAGCDISKISAITFTKAAANEFYARFQKRLIERSNQPTDPNYVPSETKLANPTDLTRENCRKALNNIDLAFMGTIDSFCNMIMSEHPVEGSIPSNSKVISDEEAEELYKREYARILNGEYHNLELEAKAKRFKHYSDDDVKTFIATIKILLNHRDCELVIPDRDLLDLDELFKDEKKTINHIINVLTKNDDCLNLFKMNDSDKEEMYNNLKKYKYVFDGKKSWEDNISLLLSAFKKTFQDKKFRLHNDQTVLDVLGYADSYFEEGLIRGKPGFLKPNDNLLNIPKIIMDLKYQIVLEFVNSAKEEILKVLKAEGKLTFNDYLIYLRDILKKDAEGDGKLIKHIYDRHSYFMIDEFQDTDPVQSEIFFYLTAKEIKPNWKECIPYPGSLFIVGDPKQSIYRFKNADVASFLNIKSMFEKEEVGEVLNLFCNFRSTYEIRDYFNSTFESIMLDSDDQSAYPLIPTDVSEKKKDFTGIFQYEVPGKNSSKDPSLEDDYKVKEIILKLVHNPNYLVTVKEFNNDKEELVTRELEWKDFMLITPSKPKLADYTAIFRESGIPYYVEGNINFFECPSFNELVKIYNAVTNPSDNRYFYAALKSKLFNITEKELLEAKNTNYYLNLEADTKKIKLPNKLNEAILKLKEISKKADVLSPSALFSYLIETTEVFKSTGSKNMEYPYFASELLKSKESSREVITHYDATSFLNTLLEKTSVQERCPSFVKDGNQVHLANLHKVKGLEAPIVILACPTRKQKGINFRIQRTENQNLGYLFSVDNGDIRKVTYIETNEHQDIKELELESIKAENLRLAYVAATRARNVLIIASKRKSDNTQYSDNPWSDLLNQEYENIELKLKDEPKAETIKNNISCDDLVGVESIIKNDNLNVKSYVPKTPSSLTETTIEQELLEVEEKELKHSYESKGDSLATVTGTMVHRLMELIVISKDKLSKRELIKTIINENLNKITLFKDFNYENMLSEVYDKIHNGGYKQINGASDDILPVLLNAKEVYSEVPFTYAEGNVLWNGIIDLLYLDNDGYHIIDWKTNKSDIGLAEHYKNQLDAYKKSLFKSSNIKVKDALIYWIDIKNNKN